MSKITIKGIAIRSGTSKNGHKFLPEELTKASERSQGKTFPLIKDHEAKTDNTIGRVSFGLATTDADGTVMVPYTGFAIEDGTHITTRILEGAINEVSIGAYADRMVKESEDSTEEIPIGIHYAELSTTPVPAVENTQLTKAHITSNVQEEKMMKCPECGKMMPEDKMDAHKKQHKEESQMPEENKPQAPVQETTKVDSTVELAKIKEENARLQIELAKKEQEQLRAKLAEANPQTPVSTATAQERKAVFEGYIVDKDKDTGRWGISKAMPKCALF